MAFTTYYSLENTQVKIAYDGLQSMQVARKVLRHLSLVNDIFIRNITFFRKTFPDDPSRSQSPKPFLEAPVPLSIID